MGINELALLCILNLICCAWGGSDNFIRTIDIAMSPKKCDPKSEQITWISEKVNVLIFGKTEESFRECKLKFGLATKKEKARLRVHFDHLHIHDCGVELQINESLDSFFNPEISNHEIMKSQCNTKIPGPLHAQPKHFILVSLHKKDRYLEAYNFRINISMTESFPEVGPAFHTLVIVGLITVVGIGLAATLFLKYVAHVTQGWHERDVGNAIDRAMYLYNSQEPLQEEPDLVCLQPGHLCENHHGARRRGREPEIAFVHNDGRVERFRPHSGTSSSENLGATGSEPQRARSQIATAKGGASASAMVSSTPESSAQYRRGLQDIGETASLAGCDLPPSYEEALGMPGAATSQDQGSSGLTENQEAEASGLQGPVEEVVTPELSTQDNTTDASNENGQQDRNCTIDSTDYMNVDVRNQSGATTTNVEEEQSASSSEMPLLPPYRSSDTPDLPSSDSLGDCSPTQSKI
ncbi:hypothetical protein PoB_004830700 [Plakobranchus ocellatus]|uniref:CUB domain-containing protein n=1 Tax=Plakobranchus ocellatus TaxID=259542 RepID=A0AAV4BR08_9GAST|nr:hypothetical protein PoB_004830700 [Plakobranchus ocellatus]